MASNVLPLFWHLASASKETRLNASAELVGTLQGFQAEYSPVEGESDDDEDSDAESGMEVDGDDEDAEAQELEKNAGKLDKDMTKANAEDVVYAVRRLIRGLASSREHSRLGFAVALTEVSSLSCAGGKTDWFPAVVPP
jgi:DNA polymerase phi